MDRREVMASSLAWLAGALGYDPPPPVRYYVWDESRREYVQTEKRLIRAGDSVWIENEPMVEGLTRSPWGVYYVCEDASLKEGRTEVTFFVSHWMDQSGDFVPM